VVSDAQLENDNHFLSPLQDAVSAPMRFRSIHYRQLPTDDQGNWNSMIISILGAGREIVEEDVGKLIADEWTHQMKSRIQQLISAGRPQDILDSENGFTESIPMRDGIKIKEELWFRFQEKRKIAEREHSSNESPQGLDGYSVLDETFQLLFDSLDHFEDNWRISRSKHHHHLFIWSDAPPTSFPKSFLREVVELYLRDSTHHSSQSAHILILASFAANPVRGTLETLNPVERLSMQRGDFRGGWMLTSSPDAYGKDSAKKCKDRIRELGIDPRKLSGFDRIRHECQHQSLEHGSVAIFLRCGVHSWLKSRGIDGEQVMTTQ